MMSWTTHAHIGPVTLLRYFQEAAALDAASFAFGWEQLQEKNLAWVLTHMQLEMLGEPAPKQTVFRADLARILRQAVKPQRV